MAEETKIGEPRQDGLAVLAFWDGRHKPWQTLRDLESQGMRRSRSRLLQQAESSQVAGVGQYPT